MHIFLILIVLGAFIGYFLRRKKFIGKVANIVQIIVCVLLFLLGITVGSNKLILDNLSYYCGQATIISVLSILGSAIASLILFHFCFKGKDNEK